MPLDTTLSALLFIELPAFAEALSHDERTTLATLEAYRRRADPVIAEHGGEIVDATGSELLAVFSSAVAATQCALGLVLALDGSWLGLAGRPRLGLHLGEIWRGEGRVYGNGVNVAARLMQAAPVGALFASEDLYRQVSGKLDLAVREVTGASLKNIERSLVILEIDAGRGFLSSASAEGPTETGQERTMGVSCGTRPEPSEPAEAGDRPGGGLEAAIEASVERLVGPAAKRAGRLSVTIGDGAVTVGGSTGAEPPSAESQRERAQARLSKAVKRMVSGLVIGAAFGYGYYRDGAWYFLAGAFLLGLVPFLKGVERALDAGSTLRLLDRRERREDT